MLNTSQITMLSNTELLQRTSELARDEQQTTLELLRHLHEVSRRKLFAEKGYGSLWSYVVEALHYL